MTTSRFEKISKKLHQVIEKIKDFSSLVPNRLKNRDKGIKKSSANPWLFAYRFFGERTSMFLPLFKDADVNLRSLWLKRLS